MSKKFETTVIGSYPIKIDREKIMRYYFKKDDFSWDNYIKKAACDMTNAGIDILSDGQIRDPFVNIFYRGLGGCRIRDRPQVFEKIFFKKPITVDDQILLRKIIPSDKKIIGLLAGPYTLSKSCVDLFYNDEKEMAYDFAEALSKEAKILQKHVDMISIDEPFYSVSMPEYANDLIKKIVKNVSIPIRVHVCGDVSKILFKLIDLPVNILSHEFKARPSLLNDFKEYSFSQDICLGSVRSDDKNVESVDEIKNHINKGLDVFNGRISQISPDCGLRLLPRDIAFQKLKNLVLAGDYF